MSKMQGGTIKERLTRIETLLCNHLEHHKKLMWVFIMLLIPCVAAAANMLVPAIVHLFK